MAVIDKDQGTQLAVIDTEHTLLDSTDSGIYELVVDTSNMVNGDITVLREYKAVNTGEVPTLHNTYSLGHLQEEQVTTSFPISVVHRFKYTLEQTDGTGRNFDWAVVQLDG